MCYLGQNRMFLKEINPRDDEICLIGGATGQEHVEVGGILEEHELSTNIHSPSRHMAQLHVSALALELGREREKVGGWQGQWGGEDM